MSEIETVRIVRADVPGGYCIINRADLRPEDVLYDEVTKAKKPSTKRKAEAVQER